MDINGQSFQLFPTDDAQAATDNAGTKVVCSQDLSHLCRSFGYVVFWFFKYLGQIYFELSECLVRFLIVYCKTSG